MIHAVSPLSSQGAAFLSMVFVFASFVLNGDPTVKEFGVGLAVALDATLVRCLLVPAVMELLGERAWWLPQWLGHVLPRINIEGEGWFAAREAAAGRSTRSRD